MPSVDVVCAPLKHKVGNPVLGKMCPQIVFSQMYVALIAVTDCLCVGMIDCV